MSTVLFKHTTPAIRFKCWAAKNLHHLQLELQDMRGGGQFDLKSAPWPSDRTSSEAENASIPLTKRTYSIQNPIVQSERNWSILATRNPPTGHQAEPTMRRV